MSGSASRIVAVMEALGASREDGMTAQEIVERSGLPQSTGYRILQELQELGLVHRGANRKLLANFSFQRRLRHPGLEPERLADACADLSNSLLVAAEVVVLSGDHLLWHIVHQHPDQAIRLRAHPGFVREAYELDSISRLVFAHLPTEEIERRWDTSVFFTAGVERRPLDWAEARAAIAEVDPDDIQFDMLGNAKGIRRFAVALHDPDGGFACLLTVAEAATPVRDEAAHVAAIRNRLMEQKSRMERSEPAA